jgi:hypothetical protein
MTQLASQRELELFKRVAKIIESARGRVARSVNSPMVQAYWLIGREIVEIEQQGKRYQRADHEQPTVGIVSFAPRRTMRSLRSLCLTTTPRFWLPVTSTTFRLKKSCVLKSQEVGMKLKAN